MGKHNALALPLVALLLWGNAVRSHAGGASEHKKGRLLYLTLSAGFKHDTAASSRDIVKEIGEKSGVFETTLADDRNDVETPQRWDQELKDFCAYNTAYSSRNRVLDGIQVEKIPPE